MPIEKLLLCICNFDSLFTAIYGQMSLKHICPYYRKYGPRQECGNCIFIFGEGVWVYKQLFRWKDWGGGRVISYPTQKGYIFELLFGFDETIKIGIDIIIFKDD